MAREKKAKHFHLEISPGKLCSHLARARIAQLSTLWRPSTKHLPSIYQASTKRPSLIIDHPLIRYIVFL